MHLVAPSPSLPITESADDASSGDVLDRLLARDLSLTESRRIITAEFERRFVERALERQSGNITRAAAASGVTLRYFRLLCSRLRRHRAHSDIRALAPVAPVAPGE
jgi:hypothetical protein